MKVINIIHNDGTVSRFSTLREYLVWLKANS